MAFCQKELSETFILIMSVLFTSGKGMNEERVSGITCLRNAINNPNIQMGKTEKKIRTKGNHQQRKAEGTEDKEQQKSALINGDINCVSSVCCHLITVPASHWQLRALSFFMFTHT